jgi:class 3 adenylate cyclase
MPPCSLRATIGGLTATIVLIVAVSTLAITLSVSLTALREIGKHHAHAIAATAELQLHNYVATPKYNLDQLANFTKGPGMQLPSDDAAVFDRVVDINCYVYRFANGHYGSVAFWFVDGNYIVCWPEYRVPEMYAAFITRIDSAGAVINDGIWYYRENNTVVPTSNQIYALGSDISSLNDWRDAGMLSVLKLGTAQGFKRVWLTMQVIKLGTEVHLLAVGCAPLWNASKFHLGYSTVTLELSDLSTFVRTIKTTGNTQIFALDGAGYIFATSMTQPFFSWTTKPRNTPPPNPGCTSSQTVLDVDSVEITMACRQAAGEYPYAPLQLVASEKDFLAATDEVRLTAVNGENYYMVSTQVDTLMSGLDMHVLVFMPEADIIGDVVTGRNIAIGVTVAVFVLAVVVSYILITLLLAPLNTISERMFKAAAFEDDGVNDTDYSTMHEIYQLQDAYYCMNFELNRIKSFVPQSVLQSRVDADLDVDLTTTDEASNTNSTVQRDRSGSLRLAAKNEDAASQHSSIRQKSHLRGLDERSTSQVSRRKNPAALGVANGLKTASGLTSDTVTLLALNFRGFHRAMQTMDMDSVVHAFDDTAACVLREINDAKGVLASFHGDRFVASFNAVRPCVAHPRRAVAAARSISRQLGDIGFKLPVTAAVMTGKCQVGNVGSDCLKNFNVIGHTVTQVAFLERLSKVHTESTCLVTDRLFPDISSHHSFAVVDLVLLPGLSKPVLVANVTGEVNAEAEGEWLYLVNGAATPDSNGVASRNKVFSLLQQGQFGDALRMSETIDPSLRTGTLERLLQTARERMSRPNETSPIGTEYGRLFDALVAPSSSSRSNKSERDRSTTTAH